MIRYLSGLGLVSALLAGVAIVTPGSPAQADPPTGTPAAVSALQSAPPVRSGDYRLDKGHAKVLWTVSHFGFSDYTGEFTDFDARLLLDGVNPERSRLTVTLSTASVDTHDEALDTHLKSADFFDVANHPQASFVSTAIRRTGEQTAEVTGNFTMLGRTRPLTLGVRFNKAGENMAGVYTVGFSATGSVRRSDYGMTYGLPGVGDDITLRISGEFNPAA